jgi:hypothetical protein
MLNSRVVPSTGRSAEETPGTREENRQKRTLLHAARRPKKELVLGDDLVLHRNCADEYKVGECENGQSG